MLSGSTSPKGKRSVDVQSSSGVALGGDRLISTYGAESILRATLDRSLQVENKPGHIVTSARFRQSEQQEGQEATGVSKTSDQRGDPGAGVICICNVFKTETGWALGTSLVPTAY